MPTAGSAGNVGTYRSLMVTLHLFGNTYNVNVQTDKYRDGDSLAVALVEESGEAFAMISTNFPPMSSKLPPNVFYCKDWSENESIIPQLVAKGIIRRRDDIPPLQSGFVTPYAYELISVP